MENFHIDPSQGPHAAAELSNQALEYLFELMIWELALRTSAEQFTECLRVAIEQRNDSEDQIRELRRQRDQMQFAAEVMLDIQRLPSTDQVVGEPTTGMYL